MTVAENSLSYLSGSFKDILRWSDRFKVFIKDEIFSEMYSSFFLFLFLSHSDEILKLHHQSKDIECLL